MEGTRKAVAEALETRNRVLAAGTITVLAWIAFTTATRPVYSFQMLSADVFQIGTVLSTLVWNQNATHGPIGVIFPTTIALLAGVLTVVTGVSLLQNYRSAGTLTGSLGGLAGLAGAGCASCGAGLLTLIGVSGGVALLPFNGLGVQAASIAILLVSLEYTGRKNDACKVDYSQQG